MKDNDLAVFLGQVIDEAMTMMGIEPNAVQKPLPDQQGTPDTPTIFFERMFDLPYGSPQNRWSFDESARSFDQEEVQVVLTNIQFSARFKQDPSNIDLPTPPDVAARLLQFILSRYCIAKFRAQGLSFFRVTEITNDKFENDYNQFESFPSFTLTICHNRSITFIVPAATKAEEKLVRGV